MSLIWLMSDDMDIAFNYKNAKMQSMNMHPQDTVFKGDNEEELMAANAPNVLHDDRWYADQPRGFNDKGNIHDHFRLGINDSPNLAMVVWMQNTILDN